LEQLSCVDRHEHRIGAWAFRTKPHVWP
jgi:hypothetical protein